MSERQKVANIGIVLGVVSLGAWIFPLIGFPVSITGLVLGIREKNTASIVLNVIGLVATSMNAALGAYIAIVEAMSRIQYV